MILTNDTCTYQQRSQKDLYLHYFSSFFLFILQFKKKMATRSDKLSDDSQLITMDLSDIPK